LKKRIRSGVRQDAILRIQHHAHHDEAASYDAVHQEAEKRIEQEEAVIL
jgi:hypothetical protein